MNGEALGRDEQRVVDLAQPLERHAGLRLAGRARPAPASGSAATKSCFGLQRRVASASSTVEVLLDQRVGQLVRHRALLDQRSRPELAHGRVRGDDLVHQRLRERRLVAFVVAVAAVADQVDQEVAAEARAVCPRQPRRFEARDRIVGVDVDDRNLEAARQAARVAGAVGLARAWR